jgi:hypothetical protein
MSAEMLASFVSAEGIRLRVSASGPIRWAMVHRCEGKTTLKLVGAPRELDAPIGGEPVAK